MNLRSSLTVIALISIWSAGLLLAIGSKSYDPDEQEPVDPVMVDFSVSNSGTVTIENGDTIDGVTAVSISGSFEKGGNDEITLREIPVNLDTNTAFTVAVMPTDGANLLEGDLSVTVSEVLEFGINRLPTSGQLSLERDGTTTLVTFDGDAGNVSVASGSASPTAVSFDDFRELFSDQDRDLDLRFASKAYQTLENLWLMTRFGETAQQAIRSNLDTIESMGFNSPLDLICSNDGETPTPSYSVAWTVDPAGSGLGSPGDGDTFEFSLTNCEFASDDRYVQQVIQIANYQLNNDVTPRGMSFTTVYSSTLLAESPIESAIPSLANQRVSGTLTVSADEGETVVTQ